MGPPSFVTCFVCQRDFGSQSIHIHVPSCLDKWRKDNDKKRKSERSPTPTPPEHYPVSVQLRPAQKHQRLLSAGRRPRPVTAKLEKPKVLDASLRDEVDMSKLTREMVKKMPQALTSNEGGPGKGGPDPDKKGPGSDKKSPWLDKKGPGTNQGPTSSDYSSEDYTSSSPSPLDGGQTKADDDDDQSALSSGSGGESESDARQKNTARPSTVRLPRPSRHGGMPLVIHTAAKAPPRRSTQAIIKSYPPKQRRKNLDDFFRNPKAPAPKEKEKEKIRIPEPCLTCGKEQNPERFHSHPLHMTKFKTADRDKFNRTTQLRQANSKRIVTKPLPLMYKSSKKVLGKVNGSKKENINERDKRLPDNERTTKWRSEENLINPSSHRNLRVQKPLKTRSAENSPGRSFGRQIKSEEKANSDPEDESLATKKRVATNSLGKQLKTSISKSDNFPVDIYEKLEETSESVEDSPFHNQFSRKKTTNRSLNRGKNLPGHGSDLNRLMPKSTSRTGGVNVIMRPSMLDGGPAEEPSDNEELDNVEETKLPDVPEDQPIETKSPGGAVGRKMAAIEEEGSRPSQGSAGPRSGLLTCYICGRDFGTRSLPIHEPKCLEKWERENASLPPELRRATPERPDSSMDRDEWNQHAWTASQAQLVPCWCGRTFFPERLAVHQKACKPPPGKEPKARPGSTSSSYETPSHGSLGSAKPTVSCYICGREFGSRSIAIHEPQCLNKWRTENSQLPQDLQRPEPKKPEVVYDERGNVDRAAMEAAAWQSHLDTLVKCANCPRTFLPERLMKHQKTCRGES